MIRKGDVVKIKPEWQDSEDDDFVTVAIEDEDGGRVKIVHLMDLPINPVSVVNVDMLETK